MKNISLPRGLVPHVLFLGAVVGAFFDGILVEGLRQGFDAWSALMFPVGVMAVSVFLYFKTWGCPKSMFNRTVRLFAAIGLAYLLGGFIARGDLLTTVATAMLLSAVFTRAMYD